MAPQLAFPILTLPYLRLRRAVCWWLPAWQLRWHARGKRQRERYTPTAAQRWQQAARKTAGQAVT